MMKFASKNPAFLPLYGSDIDVSCQKGDLIAFVGDNGIGKTTFLRELYEDNHLVFSFIEQRSSEIFYDRELGLVRKIFETCGRGKIKEDRLQKLWESFGLALKEDRLLSHLSGGEAQALKLCLGLSVDKEIFFLDEPSQFLDPAARETLRNTLLELMGQGKIVLIVEHDYRWMKIPATFFELVVKDGKLQTGKTWTT